jgi:hypothetical protein
MPNMPDKLDTWLLVLAWVTTAPVSKALLAGGLRKVVPTVNLLLCVNLLGLRKAVGLQNQVYG